MGTVPGGFFVRMNRSITTIFGKTPAASALPLTRRRDEVSGKALAAGGR